MNTCNFDGRSSCIHPVTASDSLGVPQMESRASVRVEMHHASGRCRITVSPIFAPVSSKSLSLKHTKRYLMDRALTRANPRFGRSRWAVGHRRDTLAAPALLAGSTLPRLSNPTLSPYPTTQRTPLRVPSRHRDECAHPSIRRDPEHARRGLGSEAASGQDFSLVRYVKCFIGAFFLGSSRHSLVQ